MTINYTTLLGLAKPVTGTETGQWGDVVNDEITSLLEDAVANAATFSVTSGDVTLSTTNGASNQARMSTLIITGSPGTTRNVIAPSHAKIYQVVNQSDGAVVIKGAATTGVTIPAGATGTVVWNGSDFVEINSTSSGRIIKGNVQITGNLQVDGSTTLGNSTSDNLTISGPAAVNGATIDPTYAMNVAGSIQTQGDGKGIRLVNAGAAGGGTLTAAAGAAGGIILAGDSGPVQIQTQGLTYIKLETNGQATFSGAIVGALSGTSASNSIANASLYNGRNSLTFYPQLENGGYNALVQASDYGVMLADTNGSGYNYGLVIGKHNGSAIRFAAAAGNMQFGINSSVVAQLSSQAFGIGRAPNSAWGSNWNAVELGGTSGGVFSSVNGVALATNVYNDNSNWRRLGAGGSFYIGLGQNSMTWYGASATAGGSGAGSVVSYTTRFTMDSNGYATFASIAGFNGTGPDTSYGVSANNGFQSIGDNRGLRLVNSGGNGGGTITANNGASAGITIGADAGTLSLQGGGSTGLTISSNQVQTLKYSSVAVDYGGNSVSAMAGWNDTVNTVAMYMRLNASNYNTVVQAGDSALIQTQTTPDYGFVVGKHNGAAIRFGQSTNGLVFSSNNSVVGRWNNTGLVVNGSNAPTVSLLQVGSCNYNSNTATVTIGTSNVNQPALVLSNWTGVASNYSPYIGFDHSGVSGWAIGPSNSGGSFRIVNGSITSTTGMLIGADGKTFITNLGSWSDPFGVEALVTRSAGHCAYFGNTASSGYSNLIIRREGASAGDQIYFYTTSGGSGVLAGIVASNGSSTTYGTSSDYRLKKNVRPVQNATARIMAIEPCGFDWIVDDTYGESFIAHKLAEEFPLAVIGDKDGVDHEGLPKYQSVDPSKVVPALVAAFQELRKEFDAYKASHP